MKIASENANHSSRSFHGGRIMRVELLLRAVAAGVLACGLGCAKNDPLGEAASGDGAARPPAAASTQKGSSREPGKGAAPQPQKAVEAKLEDIGKAYRENEIAADARFKGKRVRVEIIPDAVGKGGKSGLPVVTTRSGFRDGRDVDTGIAFEKGREDEAASIEKAKAVRIEATVSGVAVNNGIRFLSLDEARIVK